MHNSALPAEKRAGTADELTDLPSDTLRLGTDGAGADHYFSRIVQTAAIVEPDGSIQREDLSDRPFETWIAYVDERRGWKTLQYVESFVDVFGRVKRV